MRLVWQRTGKWNQQFRPVIEPQGNRSAVCPRWDETVYTRWDKHGKMWHLSPTELLFIARIWTEEVFWFHKALPALETCERREDTGRRGICSARMLQIFVTANVQMQIGYRFLKPFLIQLKQIQNFHTKTQEITPFVSECMWFLDIWHMINLCAWYIWDIWDVQTYPGTHTPTHTHTSTHTCTHRHQYANRSSHVWNDFTQ